MSDVIRIAVCDCSPIIRFGLGEIIESVADMEIVNSTANYDELLEAIAASETDVVIVDIDREEGSGLECLRELRELASDLKVIVFTSCQDKEPDRQGVGSGDSGFQA